MSEEMIDIFTDTYQHVGVAGKQEAHEKGMWHHVFTCLLINPETRAVFFQKKTPGRYAFDRPDYLDITVGGHLQAGETIADGVREIREELGVDVSFPELVPLGVRQTAATLTPTYIANEFQHLFLLPRPVRIESFAFDAAEVQGLVELNLDETLALLLGERERLTGEGHFRADGTPSLTEIEITIADFVPSYLATDKLYLRLLIAARRFLANEDLRYLFW